jgi:hypothetical protein
MWVDATGAAYSKSMSFSRTFVFFVAQIINCFLITLPILSLSVFSRDTDVCRNGVTSYKYIQC